MQSIRGEMSEVVRLLFRDVRAHNTYLKLM